MVPAPTGKFIEAMHGMPLVLSLCVMNFALLGFLYYQNASFNTQREANVKSFVQVQSEVQKLLSQCAIPQIAPRE